VPGGRQGQKNAGAPPGRLWASADHQELLRPFSGPVLGTLRRRLLGWYATHARPLPWRETCDPYRIWISEIMLQQTTVKAVMPYYARFLAAFPTVHALAAATESRVLQLWEGLGYYSRGRNLHRAAQVICAELQGDFPSELAALQKLPGIGRYTAGAIRSFAFDLPAPIVEANTLRLYARLLGYPGDPRSRAGQLLLWEFAERLAQSKTPGQINQALMELGAQVCTPVDPDCLACPLKSCCRAFAEGTQKEIPAPQIRPAVTPVVEATIALRQGECFLVQQRPVGARWAGLWDFVRFPVTSLSESDPLDVECRNRLFCEVHAELQNRHGLRTETLQVLQELRHSVTRYRIRLICLTAESPVGRAITPAAATAGAERHQWLTLQEIERLPMPVTGRKFARALHRQE